MKQINLSFNEFLLKTQMYQLNSLIPEVTDHKIDFPQSMYTKNIFLIDY